MLKQVEIYARKNITKNRQGISSETCNESKKIITHSQNEQDEKIENRNYELIIGKSKSDEYNDEI